MRKERLKKDIWDTLQHVASYRDVEQKMKALGYSVLKSRGSSGKRHVKADIICIQN
jgi:hypothetical protein